ncbi:hypothetical protein AAHB44_28295 [Pseudomonas simiae]
MSKTNHISIGSMHNSQLQQDTQKSSQHLDLSVPDLNDFLESLSQDISKITDHIIARGLQSDIETIRLQSRSPAPKGRIIKECLSSIKTVLEGAGGNVLASYLPVITALLRAS